MTGPKDISSEQFIPYLLNELSDEERDRIEESFFDDDAVFYELADAENDLADQYVSGRMTDETRLRFVKSLGSSPERREKVADAAVMRRLILESSTSAKTDGVSNKVSWLKNLTDWVFGHKMMLGVSFASLVLVAGTGIALMTAIIVLNSIQHGDAPLPYNRPAMTPRPDMNSNRMATLPTPVPGTPPFVLSPDDKGTPAVLNLNQNENAVRVELKVPADISALYVEVYLDDVRISDHVDVRDSGSRDKAVTVTISTKDLKASAHQFRVKDLQGREFTYRFTLKRRN